MDDDASVQRGLEQLAQRQPVKALECFAHALDENPDNIAALAGKARALQAMGEYQFAIGACDAALALDSRLLGVLDTKIHALTELRRFEEAFAVTDAARYYSNLGVPSRPTLRVIAPWPRKTT